jgi:hypothetical protein
MVTRVTQGHAGRPLVLGRTATFAFAGVQLAALVRMAGEARNDAMAWHVGAALLWLLAFLPWTLHSAGIYLRPRADGKARLMIAFYLQVKWVHVFAVLTSGSLFACAACWCSSRRARAPGARRAARWAMSAPLRYLSYGVDSVLMTRR